MAQNNLKLKKNGNMCLIRREKKYRKKRAFHFGISFIRDLKQSRYPKRIGIFFWHFHLMSGLVPLSQNMKGNMKIVLSQLPIYREHLVTLVLWITNLRTMGGTYSTYIQLQSWKRISPLCWFLKQNGCSTFNIAS